MVDSAIKYFFSADGSDKRGVQFAQALGVNKLSELAQVKNFIEDSRVVRRGLFDTDVHPEFIQFLVGVGQYHSKIFQSGKAGVGGGPDLALLETSPPGTIGKDLWENVIKVFGSISDATVRNFYSEYVNLVRDIPGGAVQPLELGSFNPATVSLDHLYLNLKKNVHGAPPDETRFALALPSEDVISDISRYGLISVSGVNINLITSFAKAYAAGYMNLVTVDPTHLLGNKSIGFSVDLVAFIKSALAKVKSAPDDGANLPSSSILDFTTGDIISVKDGKFVRKEGAMSVPIELSRDNCYTTQFKGPAEECKKLISDLIFNENASAFNTYFSSWNDSYFAGIAREDIAKVHPDMAVKILKKFGFDVLNVPSGGRTLQKFESLYSWMQKLDSMTPELTAATKDAIRRATHLKTYLGLLVNYVNNNPVILNSGVGAEDPRIESEEVDPQSYLGRTKIVMLPRIPLGTVVSDKHDALLKIATTASMAHRLLALPASLPFPFPVARLPGMVGGSVGGSATLRPIIRGLIADLTRKGKKLRASDQDTIEKHLDTLDKLEKALVKISQQLSEYKDWVSIFPGKQQVTSLGSIEGSIDKYRECVSQHANLELGIINVALKLCEQ